MNGDANGRLGWIAIGLIVGLVGSVVGSILFTGLRLRVAPDFWAELITAIAGAVVLVVILLAIRPA